LFSTTGSYSLSGSNGIVDEIGPPRPDPPRGGTLTISTSNAYSGGTIVSGSSILNIQNAGALGASAGAVSIGNGATLQLQGGYAFAANPLTISGSGAANATGAWKTSVGQHYGGRITLGPPAPSRSITPPTP